MAMEKKFIFKSPTELFMGKGVMEETGSCIRRLGIDTDKVLIVSDKVLEEIGTLELLKENLKKSGIEYEVYSGTEPEPPVDNCYEAFEIYKRSGCGGVIGIGGGSPLDVAKIVAMLVTNPGKFEDYAGIGKVPKRCAPLILIPTTAGTGSEVSNFSIMICNGSKMGVVDPNIMANIALVDSMLTLSVPRAVTAATGLDALCHHIESFISANASPLCDALCLEGIRTVGRYLRRAVGNSGDEEARYWMSYASTLGGYCMNLTDGAAANHGLAFAIGAKYHVGHGLSNAVMLPYVLKVVGVAELKKIRRIGEALELEMHGYPDRQVLDIVIKALAQLVEDVGCAIPIRSFGACETDLDTLTKEVVETQTRVMGHSTYRLSPEEISAIFKAAL